MRRACLVSALTLGAVALGIVLACTGEGSPGTIQIRLGEMYIKPDVIKIREGQEVSLKLVNEGREEHEFLIGRRVEMEGDKAVGYKPNDFGKVLATFSGQKAGLEFEDGIMEVEVEPGGRGLLTFTAPKGTKGEWEIACFEPGHYEAGMKGKLIVQ